MLENKNRKLEQLVAVINLYIIFLYIQLFRLVEPY